MRQRILVAVLVAITAAYCWGLLWLAWGFSRAGGAVGWGLAVSVGILLVLTVWVIWREVLFGMAAARLSRRYAPPAGTEGTAREEFERARAALQEDDGTDQDWRAWFRLGLAYDALRDRRQARAALRRAIALERTAARPR